MVRPITQLRQAMARVAGGDFHVPDDLPYDRSDEIGHVSRSFRGMTARLEELDKLKAEFMSISTHELKTPINVISGYAELMHERVFGEVTPKQGEALSSIREQTKVLTQMVNQLLDMSRIEAGGMRLEILDVDLPEMFERLERTFQAMARKQGVGFEVSLAGNAPRLIPGDGDRLRDQVLGNLISNALKFTSPEGHVTVRGLREGEWMKIEVEDNGSGIPAEQLPHVFNKFYQVGEQARSKGAGLGLAIAHEVVSGHGGEISVVSTPGRGTCFTILLPTSRDRAERAQLERRSRRAAAAAAAAHDD
jgi:signal transduction histidine kinase